MSQETLANKAGSLLLPPSSQTMGNELRTSYGDWQHVGDISIQFMDSKIATLIQAADIAAGVIFEKYKLGKDHFYRFMLIKDRVEFPYKGFNT